jgi:CRP/FNR family cyclic AMP-dependent transcriptional regulator
MTDGTLLVYLAQHPVFQGLAPAHIALIAGFSRVIQFNPGQRVFEHDTHAGHFFIVQQGKVNVEIPAIQGEPLVIQTLGPSALVGWSWMIPPFAWSFDARAAAPSSVVAVDGEKLREACEQDTKLGYELMKRFAALMAERLNAARRIVIQHYTSG